MDGINGALFTVVDVETTGLKAEEGDRVCELGAIKFSLAAECGRFSTLVKPERPIPPGAVKIHGITDEMVVGAPLFAEIAGAFEKFISGTVLVAQNAAFDLKFLRTELGKVGRKLPVEQALDTIPLVRSYRVLDQYNLDALAAHYKIPAGGRHRSVEDCAITMEVFRRAVGDLSAQGKIKGMADLLKLGRAE